MVGDGVDCSYILVGSMVGRGVNSKDVLDSGYACDCRQDVVSPSRCRFMSC